MARKHDIEINATNNEGKFAVAKRFIRTLKKICLPSQKNVYIDKFVDIVEAYNKTYCYFVKMKPVDVTSKTYINFNKDNSL